MNTLKKNMPVILFVVTIVAGTAGYMQAGSPAYESLLNSFALVALGGAVEPTNALIEIGRWAGILFALDVVYTLVESAIRESAEDVRVRRQVRKPDAVAVHGDGVFADKMAERLGDAGIRSDHAVALEAPYQVLLFSDDAKAIDFFTEHSDKLAHSKEVYLGLDRMIPDVTSHPNAYSFSMSDVCAQLYWAAHPVTTPEKIAFIGDGPYAEALLDQALLVNLYDIKGGVTYHLFGDYSHYRGLHTQLQAMQDINDDALVFHEEPWHASLTELSGCDRIILCGAPTTNLEVAADLQSAGVSAPLHIRCRRLDDVNLIQPNNVVAFGTADELCTKAIVIQQRQHDGGKIADISYNMGTSMCNDCPRQKAFPADSITDDTPDDRKLAIKEARLRAADFGACLTCPTFLANWRAMDEFTKRSNYAAAAFDQQRMRLLEEAGAGRDSEVEFASLPQDVRDRLQEVEHLRWWRFHQLHNWTYAPGGKNKAARTHWYLVPYDQLDRPTKDLDGDSYKTVWLRNPKAK